MSRLGYIAIPLKPDDKVGDEVLLLPDPNTRVGIQLKSALKAIKFVKMRRENPGTGKLEHIGYYVDGKPWIVYEVHHWAGTQYD